MKSQLPLIGSQFIKLIHHGLKARHQQQQSQKMTHEMESKRQTDLQEFIITHWYQSGLTQTIQKDNEPVKPI
jgi:hypothetical protein